MSQNFVAISEYMNFNTLHVDFLKDRYVSNSSAPFHFVLKKWDKDDYYFVAA